MAVVSRYMKKETNRSAPKGAGRFLLFMKMTLENQDRVPLGEQARDTEIVLDWTKERKLKVAVAVTFEPDLEQLPLSKLQKE